MEISQLICSSNRYSGFHIIATLVLNGLILICLGKLILNFKRSTAQKMKKSLMENFNFCGMKKKSVTFIYFYTAIVEQFLFCHFTHEPSPMVLLIEYH